MAGKIPFILGLGAGYVLGTRAGRAQYERIKTAASRVAVKERLFGTPSAKSSGQSQPVDAGEASVRPVSEAG